MLQKHIIQRDLGRKLSEGDGLTSVYSKAIRTKHDLSWSNDTKDQMYFEEVQRSSLHTHRKNPLEKNKYR